VYVEVKEESKLSSVICVRGEQKGTLAHCLLHAELMPVQFVWGWECIKLCDSHHKHATMH